MMEKYFNIYKGFYKVPTNHSERIHKFKPGEVPVSRRSVEVRPGTGREAGLGHGTGLKEFSSRGFAGSWVYLLRHASRPSMARSGADVLSAHGLRRYTQLPANCASLEEVASIGGHRIE